jgi:hypothetical protein
MKSHRPIGLLLGVLLVLTGCSTTYDRTAGTTVAPINASTTTLPTGTVEELLPRLVEAMLGLSSLIGPNQSGQTKSGKADQLALINQLWNAAETELITVDPVAAESLGRLVDLSNTAVTANHPADADKAARFAGQVVDNYLNK